ncbi:MAG: TonB-dependent receptor [Pseudomonadota bacterium]
MVALDVVAQADTLRQLEEVVVTAQKREESLKDVPISMSVVGAEEIAQLSVFDFTETAQLTPGVSFFPGVQSAAIRLRGVGPGSFALTAPQSVAVFVDDIAQGSVGTVFTTMVDVERIELLRGPQGTLYGQNAPGGAYNITNRLPNTEDFEGFVEGTYALQDPSPSDLQTYDVRGAFNVPVIPDVLGLRFAGVYADSDGFLEVENPVSGEKSTGGKEHEALRGRMLWHINEAMDLLWTVGYKDLTDQPVDFNVEGVVPGTGGSNPIPAIYNKFDERRWYGDFSSNARSEIKETYFHFLWAADAVNVDFLGSYQDLNTYQLENRTPYPGFNSQFEIELPWNTTTAELRFSNTGDLFDYIGGVYYAYRELDGFFDVTLTGTNLLGPAGGNADVKSLYANVTWHITPQWDLTLGGRYDKNDIETQSNFAFLGLNSIVDGKTDYEHPSWSVKLRYFLDEQTTAYLAVDNAYKQGGFNNLIPGLLTLNAFFPDIAAVGEEMLLFEEETSTAIELGIKGSLLQSRMSYSFAVFYQEFDNHQLTQPTEVRALLTPLGDLNALFANQLVNAEDVTTQGIELETFYLFADYWDLGWRLAYFDTSVEDWTLRLCPPGEEQTPNQLICPVDDGRPLNALPKWNSNFQLGQTRPLTSDLTFYTRFNWTWQSKPAGGIEFQEYSDPKSIFGLSLGVNSARLGLDVRLWGKNLTDEDLNVDPTQRTDGDPSLPQPLTGRYYPGRQYGLTLNYTF